MPKRATLKQVASQARVSYQTVSKVLHGKRQVSKETEARIWDAVRALGYYPDAKAQNLRTQCSRMIGYSWAPLPPDQSNPILDHFLQSMMHAAERAGYHLLPFAHQDNLYEIEPYRELIQTGHVDGFILSSIIYDDPRIAFLQEQNFPFVAFGRSDPNCGFPYVDVDGNAGMRLVTRHLLSRGHRKIAALAWSETSRVGQDRLQGYLDTLEQAGIPPNAAWIARGEGNFAFGRQATLNWLDCPTPERPTAIVALDDLTAIGALQAARERGVRAGVDVAITGFDDTPMAPYVTPPLTSVRQPIGEIGRRVVDMLIGILEGTPSIDSHVLLEPELVIRDSS